MSQTKAQLVEGLNINTSAPADSLVIDSSGRLLVGTSTPYGDNRLQILGTASSSNGAGAISLRRGTSLAGTIAGINLGNIDFTFSDGGVGAQIIGVSDGNAATGDYPGRLVFSTTANGAPSPTERLKIDNAGILFSTPTYNDTTTNAANVFIGSTGRFARSTSSIKYKTDVETLADSYADAVLQCRPVWYRSLSSNDNPAWGYWGFIAEEVAEIDPRLVSWKTVETSHDENGSVVETPCDPEPEGVQYDRFVPHLLNLIKRQKEQIEAQGTAIAALETRLSALEAS